MTTQRVSSIQQSDTVLGDFFFHVILTLKKVPTRSRSSFSTRSLYLNADQPVDNRLTPDETHSGTLENSAKPENAEIQGVRLSSFQKLEKKVAETRWADDRVSLVKTNLREEYWYVQRDTDEGPRVEYVMHGYDNPTTMNRLVPKCQKELNARNRRSDLREERAAVAALTIITEDSGLKRSLQCR